MAKLYTAAEWARLMNSLPPEDREPYSASPDVPEYTVRPTTAAPTATPTTGTPRPTTTTATPKTDAQKDTAMGANTPEAAESPSLKNKPGRALTAEERKAQLKVEREAKMAADAKARAASNPMFDPTNRPDAPPADDKYVYYYSWIGGVGTGQWRLYKESVDSAKAASAADRSIGGKTNATFSSSVGANTVVANAGGGTGGTAGAGGTGGASGTGGAGDAGGAGGASGAGAGAGAGADAGAGAGEGDGDGGAGGADSGTTDKTQQELTYWLSQGYTAGNYPAEFEQFFGKPEGILGWKLIAGPNGTYNLSVLTKQTDSDGGISVPTYGAVLKKNNQGAWTVYTDNLGSGTGSADGNDTVVTTTAAPNTTTQAPTKTVVNTYTDPTTGDIYAVYTDGSRQLLSKGTKAAEQTTERRSAFQLLRDEFTRYGLQDLVGDVEKLVISGVSPQEFAIELRKTPVYERRFAANKARIAKGLQAVSEAEYIGLEDQYQDIMRRYGLPESYYKPGLYGVQENFEKLIANDVSNIELEDRIQTAQNRIQFANPEVGIALKTFYPDITNGDLLAYALDPDKALAQIKRRITAAEIGASAVQLGLTTNVTDAEYLARYGVTKEQAQAGFRNVAEVLPRASQLGDIYGKQGMGPYTQATATQEFFNVPGAAEAAAKRRKLAELETAQFSGQAGVGALARERAGQF